jgi:uncharacterized repeat protein (TIGR01451 family)
MPATPGAVPVPVAPAIPQPAAAPAPPAAPAEQSAPKPITAAITAPAETGSAQDLGGPNGRQEPAVSIECVGPATAKVGQPADYAVVVRNACNIPVQQVLVRLRLAGGTSVVSTEPKAAAEDNILMWEVGTLLPRQEKNLQVRLVCSTRGELAAQAWVTFTGAAALRVKVCEPKLAVKVNPPDRVCVGDTAAFVMAVSNPGDSVAEQVRLHVDLSDGLEHPSGRKVSFELGNLLPNEVRMVQVICAAKTAGEQVCQATVEAAGLKAEDKAAASVTLPKLELEAKGPKLRYLDRKAVYTLKVTNAGSAPAYNVTLTDALPPGFKYLGADAGGRFDFATSAVSWFLGQIEAGQSREVNVEVQCVKAGDFAHALVAQGARGLTAEAQLVTHIESQSAVQLEVSDLEDPVEVNGETVYEVRITNTGSKTEADVKLVCTMPAGKMQLKSATGPTGYKVEGNEVIFQPLPKLGPRADAIYRVAVKCTAAGVVHFKASMTSAILTEPVTKEEATRVYAD